MDAVGSRAATPWCCWAAELSEDRHNMMQALVASDAHPQYPISHSRRDLWDPNARPFACCYWYCLYFGCWVGYLWDRGGLEVCFAKLKV